MIRSPWFVASLVGLFGSASLPLACVSNASPPAPPELDSGLFGEDAALPGPDATIPVSDSGTADSGGPDTAISDAGPQPLTLTVLVGGAPEPGVTIVFQDDTGVFLSTSTTDSAGTVTQI